MIKAFLFDLDGVITDTAEFHYQAWKQLANQHGLVFNREINEALRGVSRRDSLIHILKGKNISDSQLDDWMEQKNQIYLQFLDQISKKDLLPGIPELLEELVAHKIKTAIVSASKNANLVINRLEIRSYFEEIFDGNSVANPKPAPDLFLFAASQLHVLPEACVVVEDSTAGIEAAHRAGMASIGIGPEERVGNADLFLQSFVGVSLKSIFFKLA